MPETTSTTDRWSRKPWSNTDEDGDVGYVSVTRTTATRDAAAAYLVGEGASEALGCDDGEYGRHVKPGAEPELAALTIRIPAKNDGLEMLAGLPISINPRALFEHGHVTGWWEFSNIYDLTEELEDEEYAQRRAAREAEDRRRAREDRGPLWWRFRCWFGDRLAAAASRTIPNDRASVGWREGDSYEIHQVRGWGRR